MPYRVLLAAWMVMTAISCPAGTFEDVKARMTVSRAAGDPIVIHVIVALCDNRYQGIVPVSASLGNGQSPSSNLYWGTSFGVRTYFSRANYLLHQLPVSGDVLDRITLTKKIGGSEPSEIVLLAEAWDGKAISKAINLFLRLSAGYDAESLELPKVSNRKLQAGGGATLVVFVGHNGLMDFAAQSVPVANPAAPPRASIVLACASRPYFRDLLVTGGSYPVLLTNGLMAPEAYVLEAAVRSFVIDGSVGAVQKAAAEAYQHYQKCSKSAAVRLFAEQQR